MTLSVNRVLLIGEGAWSQKINGAIRTSGESWETEVISARTFISMAKYSSEFNEMLNRFKLIWITTTPQNQIVLLKQLQQFKKKIILEKPIVTRENEIEVLQEIICETHGQIYLSQPWTFSILWKEAKKILLTIEDALEIRVERGGMLLRPGLPPEIDWGPHDLYLLYDYARDLGVKNSSISLTSRILKENKIQLKYTLGTVTTIDIQAGYINPRKALWKVYCYKKEILSLNFQTLELIDHRGTHKVVREFSGDNPIITMLDHINENNIDIDWVLILELYEDLVQKE